MEDAAEAAHGTGKKTANSRRATTANPGKNRLTREGIMDNEKGELKIKRVKFRQDPQKGYNNNNACILYASPLARGFGVLGFWGDK